MKTIGIDEIENFYKNESKKFESKIKKLIVDRRSTAIRVDIEEIIFNDKKSNPQNE